MDIRWGRGGTVATKEGQEVSHVLNLLCMEINRNIEVAVQNGLGSVN